ncbi:hypothetical protein FA95DRAFT_642217 [Auriscalpium vulgare]|uniref:Uncharacterized protein n=1 Tax=Auriscalpium vulgare TaxID=40419 RepID=A0ACB8S2J8_9AGAM|nr:hypothetical protein FA95DRAFT_642217 [Auriscalpium vulgare]
MFAVQGRRATGVPARRSDLVFLPCTATCHLPHFCLADGRCAQSYIDRDTSFDDQQPPAEQRSHERRVTLKPGARRCSKMFCTGGPRRKKKRRVEGSMKLSMSSRGRRGEKACSYSRR